jgi:hypothetical protein
MREAGARPARVKVCAWVIVALSAICVASVLSIFLFPNGAGPFTVTRGPITVFKGVRSIYLVLLSIALAGLYRIQTTIHDECIRYLAELLDHVSGLPPRVSVAPLLC